jgi:hypothetical protein
MKSLARYALISCLAAAILPAPLHAAPDNESAPAEKADGGKKKKKKKKEAEKQASDAAAEASADATGTGAKASIGDSKESIVPPAAPLDGGWCAWLQNDPGLLYENTENPWIQSFEISGRFHYQAAYLEGTDINGLDFNDTYDEYRRLRFGTKTEFLRYFTAEINVNLVDDNRFRDDPFNELEWGYDTFDEASLEFDIGKAFGTGWLDGIKLKYGRMKLKMTEEAHMSSNEIYTIERSGLADKLGGEEGRPTGATLELDKGDWELVLGIFSGEDDADFIGGWNDGQFYYASLQWKPDKDFKMVLDYTQNDPDGADDALGYGWAIALSSVYDKKNWGILGQLVYGDNGGGVRAPIPRRQGDFHGFVVMPWYWIIEDKLQAVIQYQYASSTETQGLQLPSRYVRGARDNPAVDIDNGRGSEHHMIYAGLNYYICGDNLKIMGGVSYDDLSTRDSDLDALTYMIAFRTSF